MNYTEELYKKHLKETEELLEKRFEEIIRLTQELHEVTEKMKLDYLKEKQMQVNAMRLNDIVEELKEEYKLVLAICSVYEIRTLGECLNKPGRKKRVNLED